MVHVTGTVHDVADNPDRVERIVVRAVEPRMHGTTYVTEESVQFPVVDGVLDFDVLPGACVVAFLRPHGATTYEKLMVPDVDEATFRECLDAGVLLEEGTRSAIEKVVRQIQEELDRTTPLVGEIRTLHTEVSNDRTAVDGFAKAAQTSAAEAATSESNAKGHETAAGDFAAVATTAATEAVDAMDHVTEIVAAEYATQSDLGNAVANSLDADTALVSWTADAVGGRNLALGAAQEPVVCVMPPNSYYRDIGEDVLLEVGQTYTFSLIVDKLSDDDHPVQVHLGTGNGRSYSRDIISARENDIPYGKRFSITFTPTEYELEGEGRTHLAWRLRNNRQETTVAYRELKVERGHVATPWTPSPEDTAQSLSEGSLPSSLPSPFPAHDPALALRVDNSAGTRVFMGDVMIYGDTGWRDISGDISDRESGRLMVRRIGEQVFVVADALKLTSTGSVSLPRLRISFYPISRVRGAWNESLSVGTTQGSYNISNTGYFNIYGVGSGAIEINETYLTDRAWPTTLPGTPA